MISLDPPPTSYVIFVPDNAIGMKYTVKRLAKLAGVSVRTLHHYDQIGLLAPSERTEAGYRLYGEQELLRLQQILFYKELDFSLEAISAILDDPAFDMVQALHQHRAVLVQRSSQITLLLETIDKTILKLTGGPDMLSNEDLYAGFPKETAEAWRNEAINRWGKSAVEGSEEALRSIGKEGMDQLQEEGAAITSGLAALMHLEVSDPKVQELMDAHYRHILQWWGKLKPDMGTADAYRGLANLYLMDERYTYLNGKQDLAYTAFLTKAMIYYVDALKAT